MDSNHWLNPLSTQYLRFEEYVENPTGVSLPDMVSSFLTLPSASRGWRGLWLARV